MEKTLRHCNQRGDRKVERRGWREASITERAGVSAWDSDMGGQPVKPEVCGAYTGRTGPYIDIDPSLRPHPDEREMAGERVFHDCLAVLLDRAVHSDHRLPQGKPVVVAHG